jgi:hypothetical protein
MKFLEAPFLFILQNTGACHIAHPVSSKIVQKNVLQSECTNALCAMSQDGKFNLLIVNSQGKIAETYKYESNG